MMTFTARRSKPELVAPARPTPRETKVLSDLDDQWTLRYYETVVGFFRVCPKMAGLALAGGNNNIAAKVIKAAVAEALVYYYPVAGRLRTLLPGVNKLAVDCTAEGVVFVEATADVRLEELGEPLLPPYPCAEEFLGDAGDTRAILDKPLLFLQVTQLKCGGFVIGLHMCHCIFDAFGLLQFIKTIAGFAGGEPVPSTMPVWGREFFTARTPPSITHVYPAYKPILDGFDRTGDDVMLTTPPESMEMRYFSFGPKEISCLRSQVPSHLIKSTTSFELLTAVMWRCRTLALGYEPDQRVRLMFTLNLRGRWNHGATVPLGYYGNAHFSPMVMATVDELARQPLADTVELMCTAKSKTIKECMESMVDLLASWREQPAFPMDRTYEVSDTKWVGGGGALHCGVAEMVGGGTPFAGDLTSKLISYHMKCKNEDGEDSVVVSMLMPKPAMERFTKEMSFWLNSYI
ncbi:hypothetical protein E2562_025456 [Oryza meyeriana var. granulata]|uniref:Uncharacterized protein n=1 Tax=Oryza meyeriana var. granulata TaxID=110450 RepID=A0A6G1D8M8_9ORYZ|nr:hypothetical protein E2562_025456 [Oryza meyeriana var. granulata]